jgi:hypothetical protein
VARPRPADRRQRPGPLLHHRRQPPADAGALNGKPTPRPILADLAGKVWTSPWSALGLLAAVAGYILGEALGTRPRFRRGASAIRITGFPVGRGALCLGNVQLYAGGATPETIGRPYAPGLKAIPLGDHEDAHTRQYQILGPAFVPLYFLYGGFSADNPFETSADHCAAGVGGPFACFRSGPLASLRDWPR